MLFHLFFLWQRDFTKHGLIAHSILQTGFNFLEQQFENFHLKFSINWRSWLFANQVIDLICCFWRIRLNALYSLASWVINPKNDFISTKPIWMAWEKCPEFEGKTAKVMISLSSLILFQTCKTISKTSRWIYFFSSGCHF